MYGKKIKYFRLKSGLTIEELASRLSLTKSCISQYENDKRDPDEVTLNKIANIFNISWLRLMPDNIKDIEFKHNGFKKKIYASNNDIDLLIEDIEIRCKNQIMIMDILGNYQNNTFKIKQLDKKDNIEENAYFIRKSLGLSISGPISTITNNLENKGIIVISFPCKNSIEGLNGSVNNIPYIFFNSNLSVERQRFILIHEFTHLFFNHLNEDNKTFEKYINKLTGHILIPDKDLYKIFGKLNHNIDPYLRRMIAKIYKISTATLITRLYESNIISKQNYKNYFKLGNLKDSHIDSIDDSETPTLFNQQVYLALDSSIISKSKACELLNISMYELINTLSE